MGKRADVQILYVWFRNTYRNERCGMMTRSSKMTYLFLKFV